MDQTLLGITRWVALTVWRDGGQRGARRNAWSAMAGDTTRARQRAEAEELLRRAAEHSTAVTTLAT
jgi:hypothetical protein